MLSDMSILLEEKLVCLRKFNTFVIGLSVKVGNRLYHAVDITCNQEVLHQMGYRTRRPVSSVNSHDFLPALPFTGMFSYKMSSCFSFGIFLFFKLLWH